ncbi:MAG TPA: hypothetical protein VMA53_27510 [Stellaceae bacterium]|nr:hypothetical protein [Stellaceae bacterium]
MPSCRNDRRLALAVAALALLMPAAALAQVGPPVHLLPPAPGAGPAVPGPPPAPTPAPAAATDEAIRTTPLAPVDSAWIGALEGGANALPDSMWQGTPRRFVAAALPQLQPTTSPALQLLAHRLLLSNAIAPSGEDPPNQPGLAALRVERLIALGEVDGALGVLEALPAETRTDPLDHERAELYFAKNDVAGACRRVQEGIDHYQTVWWQRALIACQTLAGQRAEASLGLSLLREQKAPPDRVFDELIDAAEGHAIRITSLPDPSPILVTLLAAAKLPLPAEAAASADLPTLLAWAGNEAVPPLQRLAAAERATDLGAMPPSVLGDLYAKVEFKPDELGSAIRQAKAPATPRERALLYQVARNDPASAVRATALKALLAEARKRGDFFTTARLVAPILAQLPPSGDLGPFAAEAVRTLYAGGRPEAATPWLVYADPATVPLLLALPQLAGPGGDAKVLHDAVAAAGHNADLARLLLSLMTALGIEVTPGDWAPLIAPAHDAPLPNAALWLDQQQAAAGNRVGETVLTTLLLARAGDHLSTEPIVVAAAVSGLKAVGLDQDAHALAVEAALAAGL